MKIEERVTDKGNIGESDRQLKQRRVTDKGNRGESDRERNQRRK